MTSQPSAMAPAVCLHAPYDIRGHWVNLADLDERTEMIVDYEYFPHDYINCPPSSPHSRRGRTSMNKCHRHCGQRSWRTPMTTTVTRTPTACRSQVVSWRPTWVSMSRSMTTSTATSFYSNLAGDLIEEVNSCPEVVQRYFSWQSYIADAKYDYTVLPAPGSGYFIFRNL